MSRLYRRGSGVFAGGPTAAVAVDSYLEKFIKLVPSEIIATYMALKVYAPEIASAFDLSVSSVIWFFILLLSGFIVVFVVQFSKEKAGDKVLYGHMLLSLLAFFIWVLNISGSDMFSKYVPAVGSVLVIVFALIAHVYKGAPK